MKDHRRNDLQAMLRNVLYNHRLKHTLGTDDNPMRLADKLAPAGAIFNTASTEEIEALGEELWRYIERFILPEAEVQQILWDHGQKMGPAQAARLAARSEMIANFIRLESNVMADSNDLIDDETPDIRADADKTTWPGWFDEPNAHFGGKSPADFIAERGENGERIVRNLLRNIKYVGVT